MLRRFEHLGGGPRQIRQVVEAVGVVCHHSSRLTDASLASSMAVSFSLAEELRAFNIRVSVVCPGSVNTEFSAHEGRDLSRMLTPADVAHAVAMLVTQRPESFISEIVLRPTQKP